MITKYQAGITIGFTLAALFGSQMIGDRLRSALSRSFTDNVSDLGNQQSTVSDRSWAQLNSDRAMFGVTLRRTRVYVAANGVIYVACQDNALLAIDAESGQEKWKYSTPHPPISHPVVGDGIIYFIDEEGIMYALGSS